MIKDESSSFDGATNLTVKLVARLKKIFDESARLYKETKGRSEDSAFISAMMDRGVGIDDISKFNEKCIDNCVFYQCENYREFEKTLSKNNIPHMTIANDKNPNIILCVPTQYKEITDRLADEISKKNAVQSHNNLGFVMLHAGEDGIQYNNISPYEAKILRTELNRAGVDYILTKMKDDKYRLVSLKRYAEEVRAAMLKSKAVITNEYKQYVDNLEKVYDETQKRMNELHSSSSGKRYYDYCLIFTDAENPSTFYKYDEQGLAKIKDGRRENITQENNSSSKNLLKYVKQAENKMWAPMFKMISKEEFIKHETSKNKEPLFSVEEIEKAKAKIDIAKTKSAMAIEAGKDGYVAMAQTLAAQIAGIANDDRQFDKAVNDSVKFSEIVAQCKAADQYRMGVDELLDRYEALNLSATEDVHVMDFIRSVYGEVEREEKDADIAANLMPLKNLKDYWDVIKDMEERAFDEPVQNKDNHELEEE